MTRNGLGEAFVRVRGAGKSGIGGTWNKGRVIFAMRLARRVARSRRALSVAIPVLAYIWRYSFEMKTKASRARSVGVHAERFQIADKP